MNRLEVKLVFWGLFIAGLIVGRWSMSLITYYLFGKKRDKVEEAMEGYDEY